MRAFRIHIRRTVLAAGMALLLSGATACLVAPAVHAAGSVPDYTVDIKSLPNRGNDAADQGKFQAILTIIFGVLGAFSLLMVTVGGFRYITSVGDPQAATKAKDSIIYALVGLVVSISAVAIVTFVLGRF